jgi:hypothetical protein
MNIEDKYKSQFQNRRISPEPKLWKEIAERLDKKSNSTNYWMITVACIVIGLLFYSYEFEQIEQPKLAQQIQLQKFKPTSIIDENAKQYAVSLKKLKTIIEPKKRSETVFTLPVKVVKKIVNKSITAGIKYTNVTFIKLKIKAKPNRKPQRKRFDNPLEKLIDLTKFALKKTSTNIQFPIIEIDYKSLLTLNDQS